MKRLKTFRAEMWFQAVDALSAVMRLWDLLKNTSPNARENGRKLNMCTRKVLVHILKIVHRSV